MNSPSTKSESAFNDFKPGGSTENNETSILSSDGHHNLPDIDVYHRKKCCTQSCWNLLSQFCFMLGALCYIVNGAGWLYLEIKYGPNATDATEAAFDENATEYLYSTYYYAKYQEIDGQFGWWEIAGAVFYLLNPLVDFMGGALQGFCLKPTMEMKKKVRPKILYAVPWDSLGAVLFLVGSLLYIIEIIIVRNAFEYGDAANVVDFFAAFAFVIDALVYFLGRIVRIQLDRGTPQAKAIIPFCGPWTGIVSFDFGFYGDILFLAGALVEVKDHFEYDNTTNLVAQSLWFLDAVLYLIEWILVTTTNDGLRFSERSAGKRYSGVSNVSRRQSLLDRINATTSVNGGTKPVEDKEPSPRKYGSIGVEDC